MFAIRGTEPITPPAGAARRTGLMAAFRHWLGIGREIEAAEPAPAEGAPPAPADEAHVTRFSIEELEAAIEESMRSGTADLDAATREWARRHRERHPGRSGGSRRSSRHRPASGASREVRAFGGDLYPTAVHGHEREARFVKVSAWSGSTPPKPH